jgi:ABC-type uncharacterized transport system ATPase component
VCWLVNTVAVAFGGYNNDLRYAVLKQQWPVSETDLMVVMGSNGSGNGSNGSNGRGMASNGSVTIYLQ